MLRFVTLSGFLGAGKTTTMTRAAALLGHRGYTPAVITNDQGEQLVDSASAEAANAEVREVTGGCFCCRFEDLAEVTMGLDRQQRGVDVVIAEAVGSCTDVTATVIRPLRQYYGDRLNVAPLTTVVDPIRFVALASARSGTQQAELAWLFHTQLEDADIIAVNKIDLYPPHRVAEILDMLRERFPDARVHGYSATTGEGFDALLDLWTSSGGPSRGKTLDIDYARYGAAEALFGWVDRQLVLRRADTAGLDVDEWVAQFLKGVEARCEHHQSTIGHVKAHVTSARGATRGNLVGAGTAQVQTRHGQRVERADALLNARVACQPDILARIVEQTAYSACRAAGGMVETITGAAFTPSQPDPTHRLAGNST